MPCSLFELRYLISRLMVGSAEMVSMTLMRGNPRARGARPGTALLVPAPALPPPSIPPVESGSASDVQEVPIEEAREEGSTQIPSQGRKKPVGEKGPRDTSDEPPAPRQRPKSVRELCSAHVGVDSRDYHAIRMCNLPEQASDAPLVPDLRPLTHGTPFWQSGEASATYSRRVAPAAGVGPVHSSIRGIDGRGSQSYGVGDPSTPRAPGPEGGGESRRGGCAEVRATEAQSLAEHLRVELDEANGRWASVEADLEKARSESASLERQLIDLRERLGDFEGQLRNLPKRVVKKYKESPGFEMGIVRMGRVSLEFGYQLALARLQARHPGVEIELDPFVTLPVDADVPMADERPFDDSLSPPEE
ncbi:hypothetical protein BHM03_00019180 [Ensete ventricosum]|nr:hypothetical protein BHM03_00019180 [Ensete ventricosum]